MRTWINQKNKIRSTPDKSILTKKDITDPILAMIKGGKGFDDNGIEAEFMQAVINEVSDLEEEQGGKAITTAQYKEITNKTATPGFVIALRDKYREKVNPAADTFTVTQQLNTAFETNELTGVDNSQKRGLIKTRVEKIIRIRKRKPVEECVMTSGPRLFKAW